MNVQTIRVEKSVSKKVADAMVKKLGYKVKGVSPNPQYKNFHSYRQIQPNKFIQKSFRVKVINNSPKVFIIIGKLKK